MRHAYQDPVTFDRARLRSGGATVRSLAAGARRISAHIGTLIASDRLAVRLAASGAFVAALALLMWRASAAIMAG